MLVQDGQGHLFRLRTIVCPTCGPGQTKLIGLRGGRHHRYRLGVTSTIVRCERCGLLFPNPFPVPVDPEDLYSDPVAYFARHPELERIREYRDLIRQAIARSGVNQPSLLDVGSGRGDLLVAAHQEGLTDVVGLEFAEAMVSFAQRRHGIDLLKTTLADYVRHQARLFDVVILNAIIEHVYDPDQLIADVTKVLRPRGVLYIDTPRDPNLLTWIGNAYNRLLRRSRVLNLSPTWPPYHVFGFSPRSLKILLTKHGIKIESIRIHNNPEIPARGDTNDHLRAFVGTQILRIANVTGTSSNMFVWARRR